MIKRAIAESVITDAQRFALHGLKHRGITDSDDNSAGGHRTEAMRQRYDHEVPVVKTPDTPVILPVTEKRPAPPLAFVFLKLFLMGFWLYQIVPLIRIERMTYCLQDSCSTN